MSSNRIRHAAVTTGVLAALATGTVPAAADDLHPPIGRNYQPLHVVDRIAAAQVRADSVGYATAACLPGETLLGGGFTTVALAYRSTLTGRTPVDLYPVVANRPDATGRTWTAGIANRTDGDTVLVTHVECTTDPVTTTVSVSYGSAPGVTERAGCPAGAPAIAGGWDVAGTALPARFLEPVVSGPVVFPEGGQGWQARAEWANRAQQATGLRVRASVVCATSGIAGTTLRSVPFTIPGGPHDRATSASAIDACPFGALTGAGLSRPDAAHGLSLTALGPVQAGAPTRWAMEESGLPQDGGFGLGNLGGTSTFLTVCATRPWGSTGIRPR